MPALTDQEAGDVWTRAQEAHVRSLYFGELAARRTRLKQLMNAATFFLSSGAAVSILSNLPPGWAAAMAAIVAATTACSVAFNLEKTAAAMADLHSSWNYLANDYDRLWHQSRDEAAGETFDRLIARGAELSKKAIAEAPQHDVPLMGKWAQRVYSQHEDSATA